jgi:hypothetical protein
MILCIGDNLQFARVATQRSCATFADAFSSTFEMAFDAASAFVWRVLALRSWLITQAEIEKLVLRASNVSARGIIAFRLRRMASGVWQSQLTKS